MAGPGESSAEILRSPERARGTEPALAYDALSEGRGDRVALAAAASIEDFRRPGRSTAQRIEMCQPRPPNGDTVIN